MEGAEKPRRKRRTKAEIEAEKAAKLANKSKPVVAEEAQAPVVHGPEVIVEVKDGVKATSSSRKSAKKESASTEPMEMYTLKFNSPILPYAKFPLTQNKYIQDFLRTYEEDKE